MRELDTHYRRLCRVGNTALWKTLFLACWQLLGGAFVGAAIAHASADLLIGLGVGTVASFIAWIAIRATEAETVRAIREDYKRDILDSFEIEEIIEEAATIEVDQRQDASG